MLFALVGEADVNVDMLLKTSYTIRLKTKTPASSAVQTVPLFLIRTYSESFELFHSPQVAREPTFCASLQLHLPQLLLMWFPRFLRPLRIFRDCLFFSTEALLFLTIMTETASTSTPNISTPLRAPAAGCWQAEPQQQWHAWGQSSHTFRPSATPHGQPGRASTPPRSPR